MSNLLIVLAIALLAIVAWRFLAGAASAKKRQYEALQKRFSLKLKERRSHWGAGDDVTLGGEFRGYVVSLYSHFQGRGRRKVTWTSLTAEALFTGALELQALPREGDMAARYPDSPDVSAVVIDGLDAIVLKSNDTAFWSEACEDGLLARFERFAKKEGCGAFRLSKGFVEYRESGEIDSDARRLRFQEAMILVTDLTDAVSIYAKN